MSGDFAYPQPFAFETGLPGSSRNGTERSKSNDDDFFNATKPTSGRFLPHSKSGRFLPKAKPKPSCSNQSKAKPLALPSRGRNQNRNEDFNRKEPGKCQSSNLEYMRGHSASKHRERSLPPDESPEPQPKKPSSKIKNFLMSPRKAIGRSHSNNLENMQRNLRYSDSSKNSRSSSRQKARHASPEESSPEPAKAKNLRNFLMSPRKAPGVTKSANLEFMAIGISTTANSAPAGRQRTHRARSKKTPQSSSSPEKKKKPLTFKQLLGSNRTPALRRATPRSRSEDLEFIKKTKYEDDSSSSDDSAIASPVRHRSEGQAREQQRETPLSPLQPEHNSAVSASITSGIKSGVTHFLDSLYDSIIDPKDEGSVSDDDGYGALDSSVSRLDHSFNKALDWAG